MKNVKFISYDGEYPNLCSGVLKLEIDGKEIVFPAGFLISGGYIERDEEWNMWTNDGEWGIDEYVIKEYNFSYDIKREIIEVINENIPHGCCGGCI